MRIAISGVHTRVGALLCRALAGEHEVVGMAPQTDAPADIGSAAFTSVDLRLPEEAQGAIDGADIVVHAEPYNVLAAEPGADDALILDLAARGTYSLVIAAREVGIGRLILISRLSLMEDYPEEYVVTESWQPHPRASAASLAPYAAELVCREIARTGTVEVICLRLGDIDAPDGTSADDLVAAVRDATAREPVRRGHSWALHHVASGGRFGSKRRG